MKTPYLIFFFFLVPTFLFSQQNSPDFKVDQMLYYENENCFNDNLQNRYTVIYQNFYDKTKHAIYHLNSFQDKDIILYLINQNKVIHYEQFALNQFNAASVVELYIDAKNLNSTDHLPKSNIKLKFLEKENIIRDNRMLTAYHFKVKNFDRANKITYYIDHGSNGVPFSFHQSFYEEMRKEGFPLIGNVMQRDEVNQNGNTCTYELKSIQKPNKKFSIVSE